MIRRPPPVGNPSGRLPIYDHASDSYRDAGGRPCRYPEHLAYHSSCNEPLADRALAAQIYAATQELRSLVNLRTPLQLTDSQRRDGVTEDDYLQWRLR
jgi:hypothetical protein